MLNFDPDLVDVHRFRTLADQGRDPRGSDTSQAAAFDAALALWRGLPLAGLPGKWIARTRDSWQQQRLDAVVYRYEHHYNHHCPRQARDQQPPETPAQPPKLMPHNHAHVVSKRLLGGPHQRVPPSCLNCSDEFLSGTGLTVALMSRTVRGEERRPASLSIGFFPMPHNMFADL